MKYFKSIILTVMLSIMSVAVYAQTTDEVTLTVSSDGPTKEEATKNALRSAIEQAYGTFVSANTTILNDELVKDEIVTIANGNIKSYEEISSTAMPDGSQFVTLKATVSVARLISYAQSKGAETEFAGATFGMNLRLQEMNKENEKKVLDNLMAQIKAMLPYTYDRTLEVEDPVFCNDSLLQVGFIITETPNNNMFSMADLIDNTLKSISLSEDEVQQYKDMNLPYYGLTYPYVHPVIHPNGPFYPDYKYYLRNPYDNWLKEFLGIMIKELYQFRIIDNLGNTSYMDRECSNIREMPRDPMTYGYDLSIIRFGLYKSPDVHFSYAYTISSNIDKYIFLVDILRCCMTGEYDMDGHTYIIKPYPVKIETTGYIPKSDISKYNNFRVERSDLKYE